MATKIKRCLFVGLGGTGMKTLLNTKKLFMDTYGEVPPMIGFLGLDTDGGAYKKTLQSKYGEVKLNPNEQLPIYVENARPIFDVNRDHMTWLPEKNQYALTSMKLGAGQVRTNGRFAFTVNCDQVKNAVNTAINAITNASISNSTKYQLLSHDVEIHMVFSLCGGTGCGTFLNMAYLLRKAAPQCKLTGYGVLPDVFESMSSSGMAKVKPNAYGAILDLDYLMSHNYLKDKLSLDYINSPQELTDRPFSAFMFIDNQNGNGDTYSSVDQLTEMISLVLVTSSGELATASQSVTDNLEKNIREGSMDVENKRAWAGGMGVCEILFSGKDLADIYAYKASQSLVVALRNSDKDTSSIANAWIDDPNVKIRENNGHDDVIDYMLPLRPTVPFATVSDDANGESEAKMYIENVASPKPEDINKAIAAKLSSVGLELDSLMVKTINDKCGVATAIGVVKSIESTVNVCLGEMNSELADFQNQEPIVDNALHVASEDLKAYTAKFFKTGSGKEDRRQTLIDATMASCLNKREIIRRNAAITFYNSFKQKLSDVKSKLKKIDGVLVAASNICGQKIAELTNGVGKGGQTFQINLAQREVGNVQVDSNNIQINQFIQNIGGNLYGLDSTSNEDMVKKLYDYALTLLGAQQWANRTIDDEINDLSPADFNHNMDMARNISMPLLSTDFQGYSAKETVSDCYYIGVPDKDNSRLKTNNAFKNTIQGTANVDFATIGQKDRIIIYHQVGVIPPYAIKSVPTYKEKYEQCNCDCHFDAGIENRMGHENYSLYPVQQVDDTIGLWVNGFIFGLVKNENNMYYYKDEANGDSLKGYWVELSKYRDEAFDTFKRNKLALDKQFEDYLSNYRTTYGKEKMNSIIADAKMNYYDKFSQIGMSMDQLTQRGNEKIADLMRDELKYIKDFNL